MRPLYTTLAIALLLLSLAAGALALALTSGGQFNGEIKGDPYPDSSISFDVQRTRKGHRRVKNVNASGLDFTCEAGSPSQTSAVRLEGGFRVDGNGEFGGRTDATILGFDPPARLSGKLRRHGRATGTLRVHGELDPEAQPGVDCDTGRLEWRAKRGPRA